MIESLLLQVFIRSLWNPGGFSVLKETNSSTKRKDGVLEKKKSALREFSGFEIASLSRKEVKSKS